MCHRFAVGAAAVLLLVSPSMPGLDAAHAAKRHNNWVHPDYASFHVARIALVPVVTYDHDADAEASIGAALLRSFATKGYDWITPLALSDSLKGEPDDSPISLRAVRDSVLGTKASRVDSLTAPALCRRLGCDAVLSARVEGEDSGRPWMKGALVARDGTLLWTGDRTSDTFVGRTNDSASRKAAERAAARSWVKGLYPILDRWAMDFPKAPAAR